MTERKDTCEETKPAKIERLRETCLRFCAHYMCAHGKCCAREEDLRTAWWVVEHSPVQIKEG